MVGGLKVSEHCLFAKQCRDAGKNDFKKAFDTVDHSILLGKLYHLGIRGTPWELIRSYFSNRRQYVVFNGAESSQQEITVGVPQGSILGPLFLLFFSISS